ncbi:MAG TPA: ATP-binding protein [Symbiobacteriaceae bacterium]|jgi:hypothetical protein
MGFEFKKATKHEAKARVAITGPAGSGKSYTALALATVMCKKVAAIDTEHGSLSKYADIFAFDVLELEDFHPDNYIKAINAAVMGGYDGLAIDSGSHEWSGKGGCLELVDYYAKAKRNGNNYAAWADVTPLHTAFIEAIHGAPLHIYATFRSKMDYLQTEDSKGKKVIQKVGMAPITRDGAEYEFDIVGDMNLEHEMLITKSRCPALADKLFHKPGADLARVISAWLSDGAPAEIKVPRVPATPETVEEIRVLAGRLRMMRKDVAEFAALQGVRAPAEQWMEHEAVIVRDALQAKVPTNNEAAS